MTVIRLAIDCPFTSDKIMDRGEASAGGFPSEQGAIAGRLPRLFGRICFFITQAAEGAARWKGLNVMKECAAMPDRNEIEELSELFKVFGDATRMRILYLLLNGEAKVGEIAQLLEMTPSAVSHQLRVLKQNKLVRYRKEGKAAFYSLADDHVGVIIGQGMDHIRE